MKHLSFFLLLGFAPLSAQQNGIEQSSELITLPAGDKFLRWHGKTSRCYFVQVSDANTPLSKWAWAPIIEEGNDAEISYEVGGTAANGFFRLKFTDQLPGPGQTLETADFDHDGISNWDEITVNATDPLAFDTDNDEYSDGEEITAGTSPLDASSFPLKVVHAAPDGMLDDGLGFGHPAGQPVILYFNKELPTTITSISGPWLFEANGSPAPAPGNAVILPGRKAVAFIPSGNSFKTWNDFPEATPTYQINFDTQTTGIPHLIALNSTFTITSPQGSAGCGPWVGEVNPGFDYIDADPSYPILVSWSEPLDPATVIPANITLIDEDENVIATTVVFDYGKDANLMTISPVQSLSPNKRHTVTLGTGFHNLTGKAHQVPRSWSFTTRPVRPLPNGTGPYVTAVSPADFSFGIAPPASVSITFSEDMDPATLIQENIRIRGKLGSVLPGTYTYSQASRTLLFLPVEPFSSRTYFSIGFDHAAILNLPQSGNPAPLQDTGNSVFATAAANAPVGTNAGGNAAPAATTLDPLRLHYIWGKVCDTSGGSGSGGGSGGNEAYPYILRSGCQVDITLTDKKGFPALKQLPANLDVIQDKESGDIAPATTVKLTPGFVAGNKESDTPAERKKNGIQVLPTTISPLLIPPGMTYLVFRTTPPEDGTTNPETVEFLGPFGTSSTAFTARCLTNEGRGPQTLYFVPVPVERSIVGLATGAWTLLENDHAKALPGQCMNLKVQDKYLTGYGPTGVSIDTFVWPAEELGKTFKEYAAYQNYTQYDELLPTDLDQKEIKFYRTKGGDTMAARATFEVKINGTTEGVAEAVGKIRVDHPSSSFSLVIGEEKVMDAPLNANTTIPMFGLFNKTTGKIFKGVEFKGMVKMPLGWESGEWNFVQLIKSRRNYTYQGGNQTHMGDGIALKLDSRYPYGSNYPTDGTTPNDDYT